VHLTGQYVRHGYPEALLYEIQPECFSFRKNLEISREELQNLSTVCRETKLEPFMSVNESALLSAHASSSPVKTWLKIPLLHPAKHPASLRSVPLYKTIFSNGPLDKKSCQTIAFPLWKEVWPLQMADGNEVAGRNRPVLYKGIDRAAHAVAIPTFAVGKAPQSTVGVCSLTCAT
jgi:hypothetical protein